MLFTLPQTRSGPRLIVAAFILTCAATAASSNVTVLLNPAHTTVVFTLGDVLHTVHGAFKLKSGTINFDPVTGRAGGAVVIDATSGDSGSAARDRRMHKSILESDRYPEIIFTPDRIDGRVAQDGPSQVHVHGQFRIHGGDHELTLQFEVQSEAGQVTAITRFSVPYVSWGMKNPSTLLLKVNQTVEIGVRAAGRIQP
ncbi:MAG: YceI family protein [Acidobacteriota bacterium]|nr:YceI family protein [Acidobacteriota bacterium]